MRSRLIFSSLISTTVAIVAFVVVMSFPASALAQTGQVSGKVVDAKTGEPIIGASVLIEGTTIGASCDIDGNYTIRAVPVGVHAIVVSSVGYTKKRITELTVTANESAMLDVGLSTSDIQLETIEVTAERQRATESSMLIKRSAAPNVTDGITSEMFSRSSASDAGDAVKQVVGISVVDNKSVNVRGTGGRYVNVRLNGSAIPSPETEQREVPLDLFPTGLLEEIITSKTFTPDQPANFSGGSVNLATKEFPAALIVNFSSSMSYNSASTGAERRDYAGGGTDWLGIDDGTRDRPDALNVDNWFDSSNPTLSDSAANVAAGRSFGNQWTPTLAHTPVNTSYGLNLGNTFDLGGQKRLGVSGSWTYSNTYAVRNNSIYREWNGEATPYQDYYNVDEGKQSVLWGGLFNTTLTTSENHKFSFKGMYNRSADDRSVYARGLDDYNGQDFLETRLSFISRWVALGQLSGEHKIPWLLSSAVQWRANVSGAGRESPDDRSAVYSLTQIDDSTVIQKYSYNGYSLNRMYSNLNDRDASIALDWMIPLHGNADRLKVGGLFQNTTRDFFANRYQYAKNRNPVDTGFAEFILAPEHIGSPLRTERDVWYLTDQTFPEDHYNASDHTTAGYVMLDVALYGPLRFVGGARYEDYQLNLISGARSETGEIAYPTHTGDWLPMASLVYALTDRMNLRGVVSRTLARPEFRELVPFAFQDYANGYAKRGNPQLRPTHIMNYDMRWEHFTRPGEIVAVSVFAKTFEDPIEILVVPSTSRPILEYNNIDKATNYGVEFEFRKGLDVVSSKLTRFNLGGNLTLTKSEMELEDLKYSRPLSGQSPFIINALVGYSSESGRTNATLLYNAFGDRLVRLTTIDQEALFEQTRHQVDFTLSHNPWQPVTFKLSVKNLLKEDYLVTQLQPDFGVEGITEWHEIGRTISLGASYAL